MENDSDIVQILFEDGDRWKGKAEELKKLKLEVNQELIRVMINGK